MKKHIHVAECDSTQDILKEQLKAQTGPTQFLVSTDQQNMGRGRGEKVWKSMPGSLCFSFNLRAHPELSFTALEISVLIARYFEAKNRKLKLKWPNDLWDQQNKKCAGILVQGSNNTLVAGIGLNLFSNDPEFGGVYESEFELEKSMWSRDIADFILHHRYKDVAALKEDWTMRCGHLHQRVTVTEGDDIFEGIFEGIGDHGECLLKNGETLLRIYNGTLRLK